jgi:branched-chain amino acid transport system substrate-binding protein
MCRRGVELGIDWANMKGGILGKRIHWILYDDGFEIDKIEALYEKLITEDKVDILMAPMGTYCSVPAGAVADKYDVPLWVPLSGSREPHKKYKNFWNISVAEDPWYLVNMWKPLMDFFIDFDKWNYKPDFPKPRTVLFSAMNTPYGVDIRDYGLPYLEKAGFEVVYKELHEPTITDWTALISKIKALKPDIVWCLPYFAQGVSFVRQFYEQGAWAPFVVVEPASYNPIIWLDPTKGGVPPEIGNGIITFNILCYLDDADWFKSEYQKRYGEKYVNATTAWYIPGPQLAKLAIDKAGTLEKEKVKETLMNNVFELVYLKYQMNEEGCNVAKYGLEAYSVGEFIDNEWYCIYPLDRAEHKPVYPYLKA